jgi:hypothetical protein
MDRIPETEEILWPQPPAPAKIRYMGSISSSADLGSSGSLLDAFFGKDSEESGMSRPYGVCASGSAVYVTDPGLGVLHVFNRLEKSYLRIDKVNGQMLKSPIGVAVDLSGQIYLSDSELGKVFVLGHKGDFMREIGPEGMFARPAGLTVDNGRLYVVDTLGHMVFVFGRADNSLLFRFGGNGGDPGQFNFPTNIFTDKDGLIYVTDSMNFRVQIFDKDGRFISAFGQVGNGTGDFSKPKGIGVDSEGHVYVADAHFDNFQIFERDGTLLLIVGSTGRSPGHMSLPAGLFIDRQDRIYVADSFNGRVQMFQYLKEKK